MAKVTDKLTWALVNNAGHMVHFFSIYYLKRSLMINQLLLMIWLLNGLIKFKIGKHEIN